MTNILDKVYAQSAERLGGEKYFYDVPEVEDEVAQFIEKWFNPMEGLLLFEAMTRAFEEHRDKFERQDHLAEDLKACRSTLERAASKGLRWYLAISS